MPLGMACTAVHRCRAWVPRKVSTVLCRGLVARHHIACIQTATSTIIHRCFWPAVSLRRVLLAGKRAL